MNIKSLINLLLLSTILTSCSSIRPLEVKYQGLEGSGFYSTSAATKSSIVRQTNDNLIVCSEPAPDATYNEEANTALDLDMLTIGNKDSEGASEGEAEASLGGRSVNVLLTREMYFRMCEFFANTNISDSLKVEIYKTTLQTIMGINNQNFGTGTSSGAKVQGIINEGGSLVLPNSMNDPSVVCSSSGSSKTTTDNASDSSSSSSSNENTNCDPFTDPNCG